jgi:hypothetical protein
MNNQVDPFANLAPLNVKCTSTNCDNGLHCFRAVTRRKAQTEKGACRSCGAKLVDWDRVHTRSLDDVEYTFQALKHELIRHVFWHAEIDEKAIAHARRKGRRKLAEAAENRIRKSVGPAEPSFDGRQTPKTGNALFYAQHATASCCRKCIQEWHDIPMGRDLTEAEIQYLTALVNLYTKERLPFLGEYGVKIRVRRNS